MNALVFSTLLLACFTITHGSVLGDVNVGGYQSVEPSKTPLNGGGLTGALTGNGLTDHLNVFGVQVDQKTDDNK